MNTLSFRPISANGFTLLEVLIATLVAATVLTGSYRVIGSAARNQHMINQRVVAGWVANDHLAAIQLGLVPVAVGERSGEVSMAGRIWKWRRQVQSAADQRLRRISVSVATEGEAEFSVTYNAFVSSEDDLK